MRDFGSARIARGCNAIQLFILDVVDHCMVRRGGRKEEREGGRERERGRRWGGEEKGGGRREGEKNKLK